MENRYTFKAIAIKTKFGAIWGIAGVVLLLGSAAYRLCPLFVDSFNQHYHWYHWLSLVIFIIFMIYYEGIKGFQRSFSPRVAARAKHLAQNPTVSHTILAPLFCMGYFHATKKRIISSTVLTCVILLLIFITAQLTQPWRGIVDAGVVTGLLWGAASTLYYGFSAFYSNEFAYSADLPN